MVAETVNAGKDPVRLVLLIGVPPETLGTAQQEVETIVVSGSGTKPVDEHIW